MKIFDDKMMDEDFNQLLQILNGLGPIFLTHGWVML
jgi:hypothetical protein